MLAAHALHLTKHKIQNDLQGRPEKKNEAFRDLPCFGGIRVVWAQLVYNERPCCPNYGDEIVKVEAEKVAQGRRMRAFRRRDCAAFPASSESSEFYTIVVADAENLPDGFLDWFVPLDGSDKIEVDIVLSMWRMRKPVNRDDIHVHVAIHLEQQLTFQTTRLSQEQKAVVHSEAIRRTCGIVRILACAGSGKTTTLQALADMVVP